MRRVVAWQQVLKIYELRGRTAIVLLGKWWGDVVARSSLSTKTLDAFSRS